VGEGLDRVDDHDRRADLVDVPAGPRRGWSRRRTTAWVGGPRVARPATEPAGQPPRRTRRAPARPVRPSPPAPAGRAWTCRCRARRRAGSPTRGRGPPTAPGRARTTPVGRGTHSAGSTSPSGWARERSAPLGVPRPPRGTGDRLDEGVPRAAPRAATGPLGASAVALLAAIDRPGYGPCTDPTQGCDSESRVGHGAPAAAAADATIGSRCRPATRRPNRGRRRSSRRGDRLAAEVDHHRLGRITGSIATTQSLSLASSTRVSRRASRRG
jgi:hypothetical protein